MGRLAAFMISNSHRRLRQVSIWLLFFSLMLFGAGWIGMEQLAQNMRVEIARSLQTYGSLRGNIVSIFDTMSAELTAEPCSVDFSNAMRRIAFLPDGISELLYAPGGTVLCGGSAGTLNTPLDLGAPDIAPSDAFGISLWIDRPLDAIGLDGVMGTIAGRGVFALAIPPQFLPAHTGPDWMKQELVYRVGAQGWIHRAGEIGIHDAALLAPHFALLSLLAGEVYLFACDDADEHCVAGQTSILAMAAQRAGAIALVVGALAVLAAWLAQQVCGVLERHWTFEARFLRQFNKGGLICAYQPLLNLHNEQITGCEILARWRDVDGTIVLPDQFLPIVENHNLTERFTSMVVAAAHADLARHLPENVRLQLNFNIFPRDLDAARLIPVFAPFLAPDSRFVPVVELVETAEVNPETAQLEVDKLRQVGIGVYIDDFGAGYSSMRNLACLAVDGVKLDRSFAMAADDSVMVRMLDHAIDLVHASGRALVVEGVETPERLDALKAGGRVDFAQGYGIARPLTIEAFAAFIAEYRPRPTRKSRLVA
jgi:sensor c-di-GMP phosphodiesterase-like protein